MCKLLFESHLSLILLRSGICLQKEGEDKHEYNKTSQKGEEENATIKNPVEEEYPEHLRHLIPG